MFFFAYLVSHKTKHHVCACCYDDRRFDGVSRPVVISCRLTKLDCWSSRYFPEHHVATLICLMITGGSAVVWEQENGVDRTAGVWRSLKKVRHGQCIVPNEAKTNVPIAEVQGIARFPIY